MSERCGKKRRVPAKTLEQKDTLEARARRRDFAPRRDAASDPLPRMRLGDKGDASVK